MQKRKLSPFFVFLAVLSLLIAAVLLFIQSRAFANLVKTSLSKYVPKDTGVDADFSEFSVRLFPPGLALVEPRVAVTKKNILNLPVGSTIHAKRMEFNFQLFQMFTGRIRVHEVRVEKGLIHLVVDTKAPTAVKKKTPLNLHWDDLLDVRADAFEVADTQVEIEFKHEDRAVNALASRLRVEQSSAGGLPGYLVDLDVKDLTGNLLKDLPLPANLGSVRASLRADTSGLKLSSLELLAGQARLAAKGALAGNILNPKALKADVSLVGEGEVTEILRAVGLPPGKYPVRGKAQLAIAVKGDLDKPLETLQVSGKVDVLGPGFQKWSADRVSVDGAWFADPSGGQFKIKNITVDAKETERVVPLGSGYGGKVQIGPLDFSLAKAKSEPFEVPIQLERAHLHWFAAPAIKDVYPLSFRVSGPVLASVQLPQKKSKAWYVALRLNNAVVNDFQLDNQKLGVVKPTMRILRVPKIVLDGPLRIDPVGVHMLGVMAKLERSRFTATGIVDFEKGFDFKAGGPGWLNEVGMLAENPISGEGTIWAHIRGPTERVFIDFDADLKNARYLGLNLGNVKGRITWDDDPNQLLFKKLEVKQGSSLFYVDGMIDTGKAERVDLDVALTQGNTRDLTAVFDQLISRISWYPRTLDGPLRATAKVSGGLNIKQLTVTTQAWGENWEYMGETARTIKMTAGYSKGLYYVRDAKIYKRDGFLEGGISFDDQTDQVDWNLSSRQFALSDLDFIAGLDVPFRGAMDIQSQGSGKMGAVNSRSRVTLTDLSVRGQSLAPSKLDLTSNQGLFRLDGDLFGGKGKVGFAYSFQPGADSSFSLDLKGFEFTPLLLVLNPKAIQDRTLIGLVSGSAEFKFPSGSIDRISGQARLDEYRLERGGLKFTLPKPAGYQAKDGTFELPDLSLESNGSRASLRLFGKQGQLEGGITGKLDLGLFTFFTSAIQQAEGVVDLNFGIGGKISAPTLFGSARLLNGRTRVGALENPIENIVGSVALKSGVLSFSGVEGDLASGRVNAQGKIEVFTDRMPEIALKIGVSESRVKIYPFQYVRTSGSLNVKGSDAPYLVDGEVTIDSALTREKMFGSRGGGATAKTAAYAPVAKGRRSSSGMFKLNIGVQSEGGVIIKNDLFDAEARGDLRVVNTVEAPRLLGTAEVVKGKMIFKERAFDIQSGTVSFDNAAAINPAFAVTSATDVGGTKVQLAANGRLDKFKVELSSNPSLPESEILNLLAIGFTSTEARKLNANDRSTMEKSEGFSLLLHSLDFNRELQNKSGFQVQIDESTNPQQGVSVFRPSAQAAAAASPKIVIKRQVEVLNQSISISAGSTVGVGTTPEREVNAEAQITPGLSILGVLNSREIPDLSDSQISFGGDLKFQWRVK